MSAKLRAKGRSLSKLSLALVAFGVSASAVRAEEAAEKEAPAFDIAVELSLATDYMDSGFTNSRHKPSGGSDDYAELRDVLRGVQQHND